MDARTKTVNLLNQLADDMHGHEKPMVEPMEIASDEDAKDALRRVERALVESPCAFA